MKLELKQLNLLGKMEYFPRLEILCMLGCFFGFLDFQSSTNIIALLLPFIFILLVRLAFIREEESLMNDTFGKEYLEYKQKVRRWF